MTATILTFSARPITRKSASSFRRDLLPSLKRNAEIFERTVQQGNFQYLLAAGEHFRMQGGKWSVSSRALFQCLIHALDLEAHESLIFRAVTPKAGRPKRAELAEQIRHQREQGKSIAQIEKSLKRGGMNESLTREAVRDYLKSRRGDHKKTAQSRRGKQD